MFVNVCRDLYAGRDTFPQLVKFGEFREESRYSPLPPWINFAETDVVLYVKSGSCLAFFFMAIFFLGEIPSYGTDKTKIIFPGRRAAEPG